MEMGLSNANAARRLNVSCSLVQRLWKQFQTTDSVSRRPVPGRPRVTTPAENRYLPLLARRRRTTDVPQLVADHFVASGRRISATTARRHLHNAGMYARRSFMCVPLNGRRRRNVFVVQGNMSPGPDNDGLLYSSLTRPSLHYRAIRACTGLKRTRH